MKRLKILMLTRLFPSREFPSFGTFCMERAKALAAHADIRVMVPTPYFPSWIPGRAEWQRWSKVEREGLTPEGAQVSYPRYLSIPGAPTWLQGVAMSYAAHRDFSARFGGWTPDVIDAHFIFPDGYAAMQLGKRLDVPVMVTCHGSDLRQYPDLFIAGNMTRWVLRAAHRVVAVSSDLRKRSIELGSSESRSVFLQNGVDPEKFQLLDQAELRTRFNLPKDRKIAIKVAALIDRKDHLMAFHALANIRQRGLSPPLLILIGEGPLRTQLEAQAKQLGLADDVRFLGPLPHAEVALWMCAADWLLLTSKAEGWATVYFEAMSCGRPVITSNVSSAKDAVSSPAYGIVVESRTPAAFADAMIQAAGEDYDPQAIRSYAERHSWSRWADQAVEIMRAIQTTQDLSRPPTPNT